jgi:glycosyltransferase involved in cell wall biosynthesis
MKKILFAEALPFNHPIQIGGHQYARQFSRNGWLVYYFSNALSPFQIIFSKDRKDIANRLNIHKNRGFRYENIWYYVPLTLIPHHNNVPILNKKIFLDNYYRFTLPSLASVVKDNQCSDVDILWIDFSNQAFWRKIIKYKKLIYRVSDNVYGFAKKSEATIRAHHELMQAADYIIMTSKLFMEWPENSRYSHKIIHCPNGVDLSNFVRESYPVPEEYGALKDKRIALYFGAIEEWFDFELLKTIAEKFQEVCFVIIGPQKVRIPEDMGSNVLFLGKRDYKTIPAYIYHCDFGIIPFKDNELVKYVNPIKMYEFLSLGKTVISFAWDELKQVNAPIYLAHNMEEFICHIKEIIQHNKKIDKDMLIKFSSNNTWEARYKLIMEKVGYSNSL